MLGITPLGGTMELSSMIAGIAACCYGVAILLLRLAKREEKLRKLGPMRELWGPKLGSALHYVAYVGLPLVLGAGLLAASANGVSLLAFFR